MQVKAIVKFIPALLILLLIFHFSAQTSEESSGTSNSIAEKIVKIIHLEMEEDTLSAINEAVRRAAHFTEYMILAAACFYALSTWCLQAWKRYGGLAIFGFAYAVSDEIHQYFVPGRACQLVDVLTDSAGVLTGLLLCALWMHRKKKREVYFGNR